ncbi:MAG: TraR/DksA family transcriptional regulator [Methylibium sp.]|nr:TraR/DksA family transcriptional regulator [Methylibium sp.]
MSISKPAPFQTVLALLARRENQLEQDVASAQVRSDAAGHEVTDRKDEANERSLAVVGSAEIERDLAELREIALARERITAGSYGECVDCGEAIDPRRLQAQPTAIRCIACQGRAEQRLADKTA